MYLVRFQAPVLTDGTQQCLGLDRVVGVVDGDALMLGRPCSLPESIEGEHRLIHPEELDVLMPSRLHGPIHVGEEGEVVGVSVVDDLLASADELEPDSMSTVGLLKKVRGNLQLRKLSVEHDYSLLE